MKEIDYAAPRSVAEAVALLRDKGPQARLLAGGTDIIVQLREHRRNLDLLIDAKYIPETNELSFDPKQGLRIGSAVPCHRICEHKEIARAYPGLIDAVALIGGIQIQSRATVGGNLCNGSPAADSIPALIAHKAIATIVGPEGTREVPVEKFCLGPGQTVLKPEEFLLFLHLPPAPPHFGAAYLRFIPRNEMDIAVVGVGVSVALGGGQGRCTEARVSLAAVAPTPLLVAEAGAALVNSGLDDNALDRAATLARAAARPITDMRGDIDYRKHLVGVLTRRALRIAVTRAQGS